MISSGCLIKEGSFSRIRKEEINKDVSCPVNSHTMSVSTVKMLFTIYKVVGPVL